MSRFFALGAILFSLSSWGCRIVCSKGDTLWHLLRDSEESPTFQVLEDSTVINTGLQCHHLTPAGSEVEREERRLINRCSTPVDNGGKRVVFRTERVQRRTIVEVSAVPMEKLQELMVWTWEEHRTDSKTSKTEVKVTRVVEMDRAECGSSAER